MKQRTLRRDRTGEERNYVEKRPAVSGFIVNDEKKMLKKQNLSLVILRNKWYTVLGSGVWLSLVRAHGWGP